MTGRGAGRPLALALLGGGLIATSFLDFSLGLLAWLAFAPILVALHGADGSRQAFVVALVAGLAANVPAFYWLVGTIHRFGGFPLPLAILFYAILSLYSSLVRALCPGRPSTRARAAYPRGPDSLGRSGVSLSQSLSLAAGELAARATSVAAGR